MRIYSKKRSHLYNTVEEALVWAEKEFNQVGLYFGHGTDNAWDDAVALVLYVLQLPIDTSENILTQVLTTSQKEQLQTLFTRRIEQRVPVPYLTNEAWFFGLPFYVDERVIVPRSPIAELIEEQFVPWLEPGNVNNILDLCCGSGCIGIACAYAFPAANVIVSDISNDAISIAEQNITKHSMTKNVQAIESNLFATIPATKFDLIVSNPPYVDAKDFLERPEEYKHEPDLALASGEDGLDLTRLILSQAAEHLSEQGILVLEVGNSGAALQKAYPEIPFVWLEFEKGGDGVFLLTAEQLQNFPA
jgi:ribosomal protein L3 glutamine methyltransferase